MEQQSQSLENEWKVSLANASLNEAYRIIDKLRTTDNSMEGVIKSCVGKADITEDEWRLKNDVYLRIRKINGDLSKNYGPIATGAMAIEVWHAFFTNNDVSFATIGIRGDIARNTTEKDTLKCIDHFLKPEDTSSLFTFKEFTDWVNAFCSGDNTMEVNYFTKFHHCRFQEDSTDPKLNCFNVCSSPGKTSFMLHTINRTCPSGVSTIGHSGPNSAFSVDRNLDDMLIIAEEAPNFLFPGRKVKAGEASNMMKTRLTTGVLVTAHFFIDEANNNRRDMAYVKTSAQGNYLMATSNDVVKVDRHVLSRFLVLTLDNNVEIKAVSDQQIAQHRDLHRVYYILECMDKANVINVDMKGATILVDSMQLCNSRKRNNILEMARILCISSVVWRVMMSPEYSHLQYLPLSHAQNGEYIGLNVRVFVEGIFPLLVVTKEMVDYAIDLLDQVLNPK